MINCLNEKLVRLVNARYEWKTASRGATYQFRIVAWGERGARGEPSPTVTFITTGVKYIEDRKLAKFSSIFSFADDIFGFQLLMEKHASLGHKTLSLYAKYAVMVYQKVMFNFRKPL